MHAHILQKFRDSLNEKEAGSGDKLNATIKLLDQTKNMVKIFNSLTPIRDLDDPRLKEIRNVLKFFETWEAQAREKYTAFSAKLLSAQCREDLQSTILGFLELCRQHIPKFTTSVVPGRVNSDIVENM
jgi:phage-related tail protein